MCDTRDYVIARPALGRYVANDGLVLFPYADYSHSSSIFGRARLRVITRDHYVIARPALRSKGIRANGSLVLFRYMCMQVSDLDDVAFHSRIIFGNSPCHLQRIRS